MIIPDKGVSSENLTCCSPLALQWQSNLWRVNSAGDSTQHCGAPVFVRISLVPLRWSLKSSCTVSASLTWRAAGWCWMYSRSPGTAVIHTTLASPSVCTHDEAVSVWHPQCLFVEYADCIGSCLKWVAVRNLYRISHIWRGWKWEQQGGSHSAHLGKVSLVQGWV